MAQTARWISVWVIGEGLCPFAKQAWIGERVRLRVSLETEIPGLLVALGRELQLIEATPRSELETSLLIVPDALGEFDAFLDFVALAGVLVEDQGLTEHYQLVSFHPDFCFEDASPQDRANATNRSPFPTIQLLRQASVNAVLENYDDPSTIYKRNIAHLRSMEPKRWAILRRNNETEED